MTTENVTIASLEAALETTAIAIGKGTASVGRAQEKLQGAYTGAVLAAAMATNPAQLEKAYDRLFARIRRNDGGLAGKVGAGKRKKPAANGDVFKVPGSISVAKTNTLKALEYGVAFFDDAGEPRAYRAICKDADAAKAAADLESMSDDDKAREELRQVLVAISEGLADYVGPALVTISADIVAIRDTIAAAQQAQAALDAKAQAEEKAAAAA